MKANYDYAGFEGRSVALVSGKGGSGKTIVAAVMTKIIAMTGIDPLLVDADFGTSGLSFYLGLELVRNTNKGLSDAFSRESNGTWSVNYNLEKWIQPIKLLYPAHFLSTGDHRRYPRRLPDAQLNAAFKQLIEELKRTTRTVIIDCRGGIDDESLAVCRAVDDIILIVETDTTSFQASQYLVEVLGQNNLAEKLKGFIVNKVFEDPKSIVKNGTGMFRCQYLGAIPLDIDAMRDFFAGEIPAIPSVFGRHVQAAIHKAYPDAMPEPKERAFNFSEFSEVGLANLDSLRGGFLSAMAVLMAATFYFGSLRLHSYMSGRLELDIYVVVLAFLGLLGSLSNTRKAIGRLFSFYVQIFSRAFFRLSRD
jgi:septum site-determining protein MinD